MRISRWIGRSGCAAYAIASPSIGASGSARQFLNDAATSISTPSRTTQTSGSLFLVSVGRGDNASHAVPTDNKGNTYQQIGTSHTYTNWPTSGTALYYAFGAGGPGHVVSVSKASNDEATIAMVEVGNASVIADSAWNEDLSDPTLSSNVSPTKACVLVCFWWGDGDATVNHVAAPDTPWSLVEALTGTGAYVQVSVAARAPVPAGTHNVSWTVTSNDEGAQMYIVAVA